MFCTKCGKEIDDSAKFCSGCGAAVPAEPDNTSLDEDKTIILPISHASTDPASKKEEQAVTKKSIRPIFIIAIAGAGVAVFFILIFSIIGVAIYNSPQRKYERQLSLGAKYLDELDYEKAIAVYKAMLEIDPKNEEVLELLENAYIAWAESEPENAEVIYNEAIAYMDSFEGDSSDAMQAEFQERISQISTSGQTGTADENMPAENSSYNLGITVVSASSEDSIPGAEVILRSEDGSDSFTKETGNGGEAEFDSLSPGIYTATISADGYNSRDIEINAGSDENILVALAPAMSGDDTCVLLEWDGTMDVDLCAFNANLQEYIDSAHVADSENDVFLYDINSADEGYELLYMHNISAENVRSIYVLDRMAAQNGTSSAMEAYGVRIFVYTSDGEIYRSSADSSENAPLWSPCYIYAGSVYELSDYIYDLTDYKWASLNEEDQVVDRGIPESEWKQAYYNEIKDMANYEIDSIALGYIDNDNVPELIMQYDYMDTEIFSYKNGNVYKVEGDGCGGTYFIAGTGKIMYHCQGGDYGGEDYVLYTLSDRGFTLNAEGATYRSIPAYEGSDAPYGNYDWVLASYDDEIGEIYEAYYWKNMSYPSSDAFKAAMNKDFDFSKTSGYSRTFNSYNDLVKYLSE